MSKIRFLDPCPEYLYKYCSRANYEMYVKEGSFRLGTLQDYRDAYELRGDEYGDHLEGNATFMWKGPAELAGRRVGGQGAIVVDLFFNAFLFCAAYTYSSDHHKTWFEREGCGYDVCVKLRGAEFLEELATEVLNRGLEVSLFAAKPIYRSGVITLGKETVKKEDPFRYKHPRFEWEEEYRLVCVDSAYFENPAGYSQSTNPPLGSTEPLLVKSSALANHIEQVLTYED